MTERAPEVIVIGGGFAGLSAATLLCERGCRVHLLEARPTLGGRATAFTDPATGERVDNGQHVLIGAYTETFRFLRRIGAEANVDLQRNLSVPFEYHGHSSCLLCPPLPSPLHLAAGILGWGALRWSDRIAALKMSRAIMSRAGEAVPPSHAGSAPVTGTTIRDWLIANGQTPRLIELLWQPLAVAAVNQPIDIAAAAPFREVLRRMFASNRRASALGLPRTPLDEMYALPARAFIERHGGTVATGAPARLATLEDPSAVAAAPAPTRGFDVRTRTDRVRAPVVISAVAWHGLDDVFGDAVPEISEVLDRARCTAASPILTVNLWFDRVVTAHRFVGLPGRAMQWVFDKRALFGESASHLSLVSSGAGSLLALNNQELIDLALAEVRDAFPAARSAALRRGLVVREKRATFSVAPGQPARPQTQTARPGLFLAGDWIDTGLPATIESAVVSGHWAADAAFAFLHAHGLHRHSLPGNRAQR